MNNKVSIIIPVFNGERYIKECINSLQTQNYSNIEIIVVNDGSSDNTKEIVKQIANEDSRVILLNQKNSGVSEARNNGIKLSSGTYITFVDSDDTVREKYIEYLVSLIETNHADISLTRTAVKFNNIKKPIYENKMDHVEIYNGLGAVNEMLLYKIIISSWNKMFKRELLMDNNIIFNKNLSFGEGFEFVINSFLHANKVVIGSELIYNYRVDNENSVMTKFSRKLVTGSIDSQESIKNLVLCNVSDLDDKEKIMKSLKYSLWHTNCDCFNTIVGSKSKKENIDLYNLTKKGCRKNALNSLCCDIDMKNKIKAILYFIFPLATAKIINKFRIRKYSKEKCND